jgi:hypothetical protein
MNFDELCKDYNVRKPQGKSVSYVPFFNVKWDNSNDSSNDILRRGLKELGFDYINTFNGDVWFLYHGVWECCVNEVKDNVVHFYMCKFNGMVKEAI